MFERDDNPKMTGFNHYQQARQRDMEDAMNMGIGGQPNGIEAVKERAQIPVAFERIQRSAHLLGEIAEMLEQRLTPILDMNRLNSATTAGRDQPIGTPVCNMASAIRELNSNLDTTLERLQMINRSIQL